MSDEPTNEELIDHAKNRFVTHGCCGSSECVICTQYRLADRLESEIAAREEAEISLRVLAELRDEFPGCDFYLEERFTVLDNGVGVDWVALRCTFKHGGKNYMLTFGINDDDELGSINKHVRQAIDRAMARVKSTPPEGSPPDECQAS